MSFKNSGYTILDNTRSIVVQLDSKLSESWNNNFIGGMINKLKTVCKVEVYSLQLILKWTTQCTSCYRIYNRNLNFISVGLDPFTQGNKLSYSTLHFTDNVTKQ
jgi:hypothetical protein